MNYNDAIEKIINEYGIDILNNRFITRSILSDYIKNQYESNKLLDALYNIYEICDVVDIFNKNGLINGRLELKKTYTESSLKCSIKDYKNAINPISKYMFPEEYEASNVIKEQSNVNVITNTNKNFTNTEKVKIINNDVVKPVKKNTDQAIKSIEIDIGNNQLQFRRTKGSKIEIYNGNKLIDIKKYPIKNNTLYMDFKNINNSDIIYIYIPHKNYDVLTINNDCLNEPVSASIDIALFTLNLSGSNYMFKNILINGQYKTLEFKGCCNEMVVNTKNDLSTISIEAKLNRLFINALKSEIAFNIEPRLQKDMNVYIRANSSKIKGKFGKRKLKKPLRYSILSKHPIVINNSYKLNSQKINVDIKTIKGTVTLT